MQNDHGRSPMYRRLITPSLVSSPPKTPTAAAAESGSPSSAASSFLGSLTPSSANATIPTTSSPQYLDRRSIFYMVRFVASFSYFSFHVFVLSGEVPLCLFVIVHVRVVLLRGWLLKYEHNQSLSVVCNINWRSFCTFPFFLVPMGCVFVGVCFRVSLDWPFPLPSLHHFNLPKHYSSSWSCLLRHHLNY